MKTVGIVGGLGPESTIEYYRSIIELYQKSTTDGSYPPIIINSIDVNRALRLLTGNNLTELTNYLVKAIERLAVAGADFGLLSANTAHIVFNDVRRLSPLPLISIVEATCDEAKRRGLRSVSLLGTQFTMRAQFYPDVFGRHGIRVIPPTEEEQAFIHDKYISELLKGVFLSSTRERLQEIVAMQVGRDRVEGVILGGTELPLILRDEKVAGVPLLDTTRIHVMAAVSEILS